MLQIKNISFSYREDPTLKNLSFTLGKRENLALIGESGCGKSTLLKLIYGMHDLDEGEIIYNDLAILGPKFNLIPGESYIKYLAQDFDLMPYITVAENVGKFLSNTNKQKKDRRIKELLEMVEMEGFSNVKAKYLSGGQMQRVAIARVLALEPEILLLDEPFSHIDNFRRHSLSRKLFAYLREKEISCIVATHDSADVLSFCDSVLVMKDGQAVQQGAAKAVFANPQNTYTGSLFGEVNEIPSRYFGSNTSRESILLYAHQLALTVNSHLKASVIQSYFRGSFYLIEARFDEGTVFFQNETDLDRNTVV